MKTTYLPVLACALIASTGVFAEDANLNDLLDPPAAVQKAEEKKVEEAPAPAEEKKAEEAPAPVEEKKVEEAPAPAAAEEKKVAEEKPGEVTDEVTIGGEAEADEAAPEIVKLSNPAQARLVTEAGTPGTHATGTEIAAKFLSVDETALVDIVSDDASLSDILRQFRKTTGANIIYAESTNLQQRVSVSLRQVPWLQAMTTILNSRGFRVESSGDIHLIKEDKVVDPLFTRSFLLNHVAVDDLATLFNETYGTKGPEGKLIKPIATAFAGANTIVVTATERILGDCEKIIKAVDKAVPQIYIEARFIEVSNEAMHKLGLQWNQLESWGATAKGMTGGIEVNNGRAGRYYTGKTVTPGQQKEDGGFTPTVVTKNFSVPDKIYSAPGAGRLSDDMTWAAARGFSGQLSADDFRVAMSAFESMSDVKIFSNPKIIVSNGKEAKVDMTTKFPHVKVTSQRNNTGNESYVDMATEMQAIPGEDKMMFAKEAFFSWGITLEVKPRISPDGLISVEIIPTISQLDTDVTPSGFYEVQSDAGAGLYPIIQVKRLTTDFTMKDGSTAVIGGLSKTEEGDIDSGIPVLREIPWIGNKLFGWKSRGKVQKEIIVFVTVGIADPADLPEDIGLPKNAVRGRDFVDLRAQEPGDRKDSTFPLTLDLRPMDVQRREYQERTEIKTAPVALPAK